MEVTWTQDVNETTYNGSDAVTAAGVTAGVEDALEAAAVAQLRALEARWWRVAPPVLLVVGTLGNAVTAVVVVGRPALRAATSSLYLVLLAVLDTLLLYTGLLRHWLRVLAPERDPRLLGQVACKLHLFVVYYVVHLEAWVLVNLTIERLVAVLLPHKVKLLFSKGNAALVLAATGLVLLALDLHFFWTFTLQPFRPDNTTTVYVCRSGPDPAHVTFAAQTWPWIDLSVASVMPFIIIFISNTVIIVRIVFKDQINRLHLNSNKSVKMTSMTAILISVSLTFLLLTMPICIFLGLHDDLYARASPVQAARLDAVFAVVNILYYMNNSINFLLYCITGPRFRREVLAMMRLSRVHPGPTTGNQNISQTLQPNTGSSHL